MFGDEVRDSADLRIGYPCALSADEDTFLCPEKHVASSDEGFRAGSVEDRTGVYRRRRLERDSPGNVGLDRACDGLCVRTLRGEDHMDAALPQAIDDLVEPFEVVHALLRLQLRPGKDADGKAPRIPMIDAERCLGCGACEYVCPARPFSAIFVEGIEEHRTI